MYSFESLENRVLFDVALPFDAADANGDKRINTADFAALSANFGATGAAATKAHGDFNADAKVNAIDFNILASTFGISIMTNTWTNADADGQYQNQNNWSLDHPPQTGEDIVYNESVGFATNLNELEGNFNSFTAIGDSDNNLQLLGVVINGNISTTGFNSAQFQNVSGNGNLSCDDRLTYFELNHLTGAFGISTTGSMPLVSIVGGGNGTFRITDSGFSLNVGSDFVGTLAFSDGATADLNGGELNPAVTVTGSGTYLMFDYSQFGNLPGFVIAGGYGATREKGSTYSVTIPADKFASGFVLSRYVVVGPDDSLSAEATSNPVVFTLPDNIGTGGAEIILFDDEHNISFYCDQFTLVDATTPPPSGSTGFAAYAGLYESVSANPGGIKVKPRAGVQLPASLNYAVKGITVKNGSYKFRY